MTRLRGRIAGEALGQIVVRTADSIQVLTRSLCGAYGICYIDYA